MNRIKSISPIKIVDITKIVEYEKYLYKCLGPHPFRRYSKRKEYFVESRFRDLNPIRTDLAHNRPLTEKQIQVLENCSKEILRCIHRLSKEATN